jgi:hypothetical protein
VLSSFAKSRRIFAFLQPPRHEVAFLHGDRPAVSTASFMNPSVHVAGEGPLGRDQVKRCGIVPKGQFTQPFSLGFSCLALRGLGIGRTCFIAALAARM